ncbi:MAG: hypothetical protein DHS20C20_01510 [Ardenticatenaceae bacterium]|nr:MAG: hypothetical protein DHS20C20_01510 [Ardenticatenaceae bacterium]
MITVTLFTKSGCGLCEEVKTSLATLQAKFPHQLIEIDITTDDSLYQKYRFSIPVVHVGKTELAAPITAVQLKKALQSH